MRRAVLLLAAALVSLAACAKAPAAPPETSGIRGTVLVGPLCPVERADSPCPDRPIAADIQVTDDRGRVAKAAHAGSNGRFQIPLAPGTYTVTATNLQGIQTSKPVTVTVRPGRYSDGTLSVDSGIR